MPTGPPTHRESQCAQYPVYGGQETHNPEDCERYSSPSGQTIVHTVAQCEPCPTYAGPTRHPWKDCAASPSDWPLPKGGLHSLRTDMKHVVESRPGRHSVSKDVENTSVRPSDIHRGSHCPEPLSLAQTSSNWHPVEQCEEASVYVGTPTHTIQADEQLPISPLEEQHRLSQDYRYLHYRDSLRHTMQADVRSNLLPALRAHEIHDDIVSPIQLESEPARALFPVVHYPQWPTDEEPEPMARNLPNLGVQGQAEASPNDSLQTEKHFFFKRPGSLRTDNEEGPSGDRSVVSQRSPGSPINYRRTARWLRGLLKYSDSYTSRLTELPSRRKSSLKVPSEQRRPSAPVLPSNSTSTQLTARSGSSVKSVSRIDGTVFQRAINDLERLLNEALSLATQVMDQPRTWVSEGHGQTNGDPGQSSRHGDLRDSSDGDEGYITPLSALGDLDEVSDEDVDERPYPKRPIYKHADTFTAMQRRPRLSGVVRQLSDQMEDIELADRGMYHRRNSALAPPLRQVSFKVPARGSSKRHIQRSRSEPRQATPRTLRHPQNQAIEPIEEDFPSSTTEVVEFGNESKTVVKDQHPLRSANSQNFSVMSHASGEETGPERDVLGRQTHQGRGISLRHRSHVSLRNLSGFSLAKSHKRQPIARDWSPVRKRFAASVACISTALIGIVLGIYTGLVPSIQYYILDNSHATVHGNTGCFIALAIPTFFFWPLPLLHGRKPYILSSLVLAMPLLFPQALAVGTQRLTDTGWWRCMLLVSRTLMGGALGFASMNFHSILTDLFGASLMCSNPHQEVVDKFDARRHGGGMGVWLGIWTWCWIGSLGFGFLLGAAIINDAPPVWGFYISIILVAGVLLLNVACPEVRRSAYRRSVAEVRKDTDISRRLARGEVMMHRVKTGPKWWWEEVLHGILLSTEMLRQPGFAVIAVYCAWMYAQIVLLIILLGSLASNYYRLRSPFVGLIVSCVTLGALLAIPFQKANLFARTRQEQLNNNKLLLEKKISWSSHLLRRAVFTILLPLVGFSYAAVSSGPPIHISGPAIFALFVGFLSCLAISECNGLVMETFDTSDLWPGMTGKQRTPVGNDQKRTNYSSFPRISAGFAVIHSLAFIFAAGATALGGHLTRALGQQVATAVVAGILFLLDVLLGLVLVRIKVVQIIPESKTEEMDKLIEARRKSTVRRVSMPSNLQAVVEEERAWLPAMMGNPVGKSRRMNVLELGSLTRWQDIRMRNKLVDEGAHLNRAALDQGLGALDNQMTDLLRKVSGRKKGARRIRRSDRSGDGGSEEMEMEALGHRQHGSAASTPFVERDCFMGQTVLEENEDEINGLRRRSEASRNGGPRT